VNVIILGRITCRGKTYYIIRPPLKEISVRQYSTFKEILELIEKETSNQAKLRTGITQDKSGRYVAKDMFKVVSFEGGFAIIVGAAIVDYLAGRGLSLGGALALLALVFGI
jgi:hypothetical protein